VTYGGQAVTYTVTITAPNLTPGMYEAENGVYSGGAHSQYDLNASGGYIAAYFGNGTSITIRVDGGAGGEYQLSMKYAAAISNRTMNLYINDAYISDLGFPATGGYTTYSALNTYITLIPGINSIKLQVDSGDTGDVNFDCFTLTMGNEIPEATLEKIEITKPATRLNYTVGESLDITGLEVTGSYSDGSILIEPITAADVTGFDSSAQAASQVLTVTYEGQTATYTVTITVPNLIPGMYEAENWAYSGGAHSQSDSNASGGYIAAFFTNSTSITITVNSGEGGDYQVSMKYAAAIDNRTMSLYVNDVHMSDLSFPGTGGYTTYAIKDTNITINPGINNIRLQVDNEDTGDVNFDCIIIALRNEIPEATLEKIEITKPAAKLSYTVGESLDTTGLEVTGIYSDGSILIVPITAADITGFDSSAEAASQDLTVTYEGQTATYVVTILTKMSNDAAQICQVKDNKQAIWTFTTDDGIYNSVVQYNNLFKMYGLKGTVGMNPSTIQDTDNGLNWSTKDGLNFYCGTWSLWQTLIAEGHLDIANHTATHPHLVQIPQTELESEINGARAVLMSHFIGQSIFGFIDPYGESNDSVSSVVQQQHYADRSTDEGENSLNPDSSSWYHLQTYYAHSGVSAEEMNDWINSAIANNSWCIELWHGILCDTTAGETLWSPSTYDICNNHLSYVANNLDKIWNATYSEAIQYIRERQNATLSILNSDDTHIQLSLTDSLDNSLFNYPLTLKVLVPNDWASVNVVQNGNNKMIAPVSESGKSYIYFDAIPDQGNINISEAPAEKIE
jgi:peptidoglycan/xylan/chitin deacetylase (PgdA/CDA1 family)